MDLEFRGNKLLIDLSPEETSEFVSIIPDDVLRAEVAKRGLEMSAGVGAVAVEGAAEPEPSEAGTSHEADVDTIRRPILKYEFMRFVDSRLADGEQRKVQAQKGVVGRTWNGLIWLHKKPNTPGKHVTALEAERITGLEIPSFEVVVYDKKYVGGRPEPKYYINEDRTNGLDMDQAARYLVAASEKIRERHASGQPLDKVLSADVIQRLLPTYSFVGCQLLCEYIAVTAEQEGGLPEDLSIEAVKQASRDFAVLGRETSKKVFLKDESF